MLVIKEKEVSQMVKLEFKNAVVTDNGYGLEVNGNELDHIISTALGTRVGNRAGYGSGLPQFKSNCCNVTVIIDPQPVTELIEDNEGKWDSVKQMMEDVHEQFTEKAPEAES